MKRIAFAVGFLALSALVYAAGTLHLLTGSKVSGVELSRKVSFSLSEIFVNMDAIEEMPPHAARAQYPLLLSKLQKAGVDPWADRDFVASARAVSPGSAVNVVIAAMGDPDEIDQGTWIWRSKTGRTSLRATFTSGRVATVTHTGF